MTKKDDLNPINPFVRSTSAFVDIFIVLFIRSIFAEILGNLWVNKVIIKFVEDFTVKFGEIAFSPIDLEHQKFLLNHEVIPVFLIFLTIILAVGALYYAFLNSSTWGTTFGKRLFGLVIVKNEGKSLTFWQALGHYFLTLLPWLFMIYILIFQANHSVNLYTALTANPTNMILGFIVVIWINIHIFTQKKNTVSDMIIGCSIVKGKIGGKWPQLRK